MDVKPMMMMMICTRCFSIIEHNLRSVLICLQFFCVIQGKMVDGLAVTSAGHLPCKYVFHMAAHNMDRGWTRGINKCLLEAEQLSISSISFPLLGTGNDIILVLANEQFLGSTV